MPNNITNAERDRLLDYSLVNGDLFALESAGGSDSAAGTEVAGGSYVRQAIDWDAASGGEKNIASDLTFTDLPGVDLVGWAIYNPAGTSRKWWGVWRPVEAVADAGDDTLTAVSHGLADGDKIVFQSSFVPAGLTTDVYYVRDALADIFKVSATSGGVVSDITADSAAVVFGVVYTVAPAGGFTVAATQFPVSLR